MRASLHSQYATEESPWLHKLVSLLLGCVVLACRKKGKIQMRPEMYGLVSTDGCLETELTEVEFLMIKYKSNNNDNNNNDSNNMNRNGSQKWMGCTRLTFNKKSLKNICFMKSLCLTKLNSCVLYHKGDICFLYIYTLKNITPQMKNL